MNISKSLHPIKIIYAINYIKLPVRFFLDYYLIFINIYSIKI